MLSLELVKTRLAVMSMEMRKNFIQAILTSLIEKSPDAKILRSVVKIVEEWVKNNSPMAANQVSWSGAWAPAYGPSRVCKGRVNHCFLSSSASSQAEYFYSPVFAFMGSFKLDFSHCASQILNRNLK